MNSPSRRRPGPVLAVAVAVLAVLLAAGPVFADIELGHRGHVGWHKLIDTEERAGASCIYKTLIEEPSGDSELTTYWEGRLKWVAVRPPKVRAILGRQTVGWRFIVQRARPGTPTVDSAAWKTTYRSPIQKARATDEQPAAFTSMGVAIRVPESSRTENNHIYRVIVKMFWFRSDGSVQGSARHLVSWYGLVIRGSTQRTWTPSCDAWSSWFLP
jgi:hypothetical protein